MSAQTSSPSTIPKLVAEDAIERGEAEDLIFTQEEFARFDHHFKRRLAGAANTDEITGKSTMLEIQSYFCRQRSLSEYSNGT